tara:strand:+ start:1780 stop:1992 length:213 start_codon:yes stop_codon:yes gene_type:complete
MIVTKQDLAMIHGIANTEEKQQVLVRLFTSALIAGTNITAPEMRQCIQTIVNTLHVPEVGEVVRKQNQAV